MEAAQPCLLARSPDEYLATVVGKDLWGSGMRAWVLLRAWKLLTDTGIDPSPNRSEATWSEFLESQAARNLFITHSSRLEKARALVRDRGSNFVDSSTRHSEPKGSPTTSSVSW